MSRPFALFGLPGAIRTGRAIAIALLASALLVGSTFAHEGAARVIVEPDEIPPGGVVTVRLEDLPPERPADVILATSSGSVPLTTVDIDSDGHAFIVVEIPLDLPVGSYELRARSESADVAAAAIRVAGPPITAPGEPGAKDEDDMLLIPLPSGWQQSLSGPIVTARPMTETLPAGSASRPDALAWVGLAVLVFGLGSAVAVAGLRRRRRA